MADSATADRTLEVEKREIPPQGKLVADSAAADRTLVAIYGGFYLQFMEATLSTFHSSSSKLLLRNAATGATRKSGATLKWTEDTILYESVKISVLQ